MSRQLIPSAYAESLPSQILWDRIVSIEYVGREPVYDIEVEGTHNFIGNGIFAHNTAIPGSFGGVRSLPPSAIGLQPVGETDFRHAEPALQASQGLASTKRHGVPRSRAEVRTREILELKEGMEYQISEEKNELFFRYQGPFYVILSGRYNLLPVYERKLVIRVDDGAFGEYPDADRSKEAVRTHPQFVSHNVAVPAHIGYATQADKEERIVHVSA